MKFIEVALAQTCPKGEEAQCITKQLIEVFTGPNNAGNLFLWAIGIGALMAFGILTYAGVLWSLSGGGEEKYKAMEMIKGAGYGLLILIGAYVILYTINPNLLGF